ncbi:MAG: hypothetical protein CL579_00150 [Alteromonadaceae bacterium]|nr:hypothetical protein [Alteromonadaceae bacterium]MBB17887.1 hypothetical protein [Rickettsiales bacterium]
MNNLDLAFEFYEKHIYDPEKIQLLKENRLKVAGHVHSVIWELFGAILTGRKAEGNTGSDLRGWEVKSAKNGGSYEYQYHRNAHLSKLDEDCVVNHLYCSYSEEYDDLEVRVMKGADLAELFFEAWKPLCIEKYRNRDTLRFRKIIPYQYIQRNGLLVLKVNKGNLVFKENCFEEILRNK